MDEREKRLAEKFKEAGYFDLPRPAINSGSRFIEGNVAPRRCDSDGVSECVRCNSVAMSRWLMNALEHIDFYRAECLRLMAEQEWVKVSERLPEQGRFVLVIDNGMPFIYQRDRGGWLTGKCWTEGPDVTHWREIVLPTEGGKE